ncbi:FRG domain-containing protein [Pseudovibrio sp. Alg231-02]|uniref:FRG domain-containing protein n=1 Tax=Pseudovibrio sp. Alg231-02 TaxID=1922223 RepID=UPI00131EE400|nr:FRG domain-containing protein [Pseudovibrio sp. Alg231-02]
MKSDLKSIVRTQPTLTAQEFYDYLIKRQTADPDQEGRLLFRGHKDASFKLIPSALRPDAMPWFDNVKPFRGNKELAILIEFYRRATELGLDLPRVPSEVHRSLMEADENSCTNLSPWFPNENLRELIALAQHYGMKTRLLDWTRSSGAAMTFAASGALNILNELLREGQPRARADDNFLKELSFQQIHVWVLNRDRAKSISKNAMACLKNEYSRKAMPFDIDFVEPPTQSNKNIVAQLGAFTLHQPHIMNEKWAHLDKVNLPLDEAILCCHRFLEVHKDLSNADRLQMILECVTLPILEVPKLLRILKQHNMDSAKLFPGFEGCVQAVNDTITLKHVQSKLDSLAVGVNLETI